MKKTILGCLMFLATTTFVGANEQSDFERGYQAGLAAANQASIWTCSATKTARDNSVTASVSGDGVSRAQSLLNLLATCAESEWWKSCQDQVRAGKFQCKKL